jgi:hypothetical protein
MTVLELNELPEHTATLTDKRGEVVFSCPLGELRVGAAGRTASRSSAVGSAGVFRASG